MNPGPSSSIASRLSCPSQLEIPLSRSDDFTSVLDRTRPAFQHISQLVPSEISTGGPHSSTGSRGDTCENRERGGAHDLHPLGEGGGKPGSGTVVDQIRVPYGTGRRAAHDGGHAVGGRVAVDRDRQPGSGVVLRSDYNRCVAGCGGIRTWPGRPGDPVAPGAPVTFRPGTRGELQRDRQDSGAGDGGSARRGWRAFSTQPVDHTTGRPPGPAARRLGARRPCGAGGGRGGARVGRRTAASGMPGSGRADRGGGGSLLRPDPRQHAVSQRVPEGTGVGPAAQTAAAELDVVAVLAVRWRSRGVGPRGSSGGEVASRVGRC